MNIFNQVRIIYFTTLTIKAIEPKLRKTTQCLNYAFTLITYECRFTYISVSSAKYDKIIKITKFVSLYHFAKPKHFSKEI